MNVPKVGWGIWHNPCANFKAGRQNKCGTLFVNQSIRACWSQITPEIQKFSLFQWFWIPGVAVAWPVSADCVAPSWHSGYHSSQLFLTKLFLHGYYFLPNLFCMATVLFLAELFCTATTVVVDRHSSQLFLIKFHVLQRIWFNLLINFCFRFSFAGRCNYWYCIIQLILVHLLLYHPIIIPNL